MKKKIWGYGALGLFAYGVFLILQLPATTLIQHLSERLPGFQVEQAEGSVFYGTAQNIRMAERSLQTLHWSWRPWGLLLGRLEYQLTVNDAEADITAIARMAWNGQLHLHQISGFLPLPKAISLAGRAPPPLNGELELAIDELLLDQRGKPLAAWGNLQLHNAHTAFGRTLELGDINLQLSTQNQVIRGDFKDSGGPLELVGFLTLDGNDAYQFNSQIGLRNSGSQDLRQALNLLGRPDGDGRWRLQHSGKLTL